MSPCEAGVLETFAPGGWRGQERKLEHEDKAEGRVGGARKVLGGTCPTTLSQLRWGRGVALHLRYGIFAWNLGGRRAYRAWGFRRGTGWGAGRGTRMYRRVPALTSAVRRMLRGGSRGKARSCRQLTWT